MEEAEKWRRLKEYRDLVLEGIREGRPEFIRHYDHELTCIELPHETHAPLLITVGERETIPAKRSAHKLCRMIAGARGALVPGVGHAWSLEAPYLFTETVRAWITDAPLPAKLIMF